MTAELDRGLAALRQQFAAEITNKNIIHLGITNCRRKNNTTTGPWSEHAWPNAVDVMMRDWAGRRTLGDQIAAWMRAHPEFWSEVFWQVAAHFDHVHGTANPRKNFDNKQIPPCASGIPSPPTLPEDYDMRSLRILVAEAGNKGWLDATEVTYWMGKANTPDDPEWQDFEDAWSGWKQTEWKQLQGHPHGPPSGTTPDLSGYAKKDHGHGVIGKTT